MIISAGSSLQKVRALGRSRENPEMPQEEAAADCPAEAWAGIQVTDSYSKGL